VKESFDWRPIDVLINNAGLTRSGFMEEFSVEDINSVVQTNLLGSLYPLHAVLPQLKLRSRDHPISIVFVGSLASLVRNCRCYPHIADTIVQEYIIYLIQAIRRCEPFWLSGARLIIIVEDLESKPIAFEMLLGDSCSIYGAANLDSHIHRRDLLYGTDRLSTGSVRSDA
jgi:hypothetical protein